MKLFLALICLTAVYDEHRIVELERAQAKTEAEHKAFYERVDDYLKRKKAGRE